MDKEVKAIVSCFGDSSVGIFGSETKINLQIEKQDFNDETAKFVTEKLTELFNEIWDDNVKVEFENYKDKCRDCGTEIEEGYLCKECEEDIKNIDKCNKCRHNGYQSVYPGPCTGCGGHGEYKNFKEK